MSHDHDHEETGQSTGDPLMDAIAQFINARDWGASREVLDAHPELLTPPADAALRRLIDGAQAQQDLRLVAILTTHRDLLALCRDVGADRAFEQATGGPQGGPDPLQIIADNTIAVLTSQPERRAEWQAKIEEVLIQTDLHGDVNLGDLLRGILRLLAGDSPDQVQPQVIGPFAEVWDHILAGIGARGTAE